MKQRKIKEFKEFTLKEDETLKDKLDDFCSNYLSFLIDNHFEVNATTIGVGTFLTISKKDQDERIKLPIFRWTDIKDEFLPFIEILKTHFEIDDNNLKFAGYQPVRKLTEYSRAFYINELEDIPDDAICKYITMKINK